MGLNYKGIKNDRQWRATIGLPRVKFEQLVEMFKVSYEELNEVSLEQGAKNLKKELTLKSYEEVLFYVLFQLKNGLTYDVLGFLVGVDSSQGRKLFERYRKVLEISLFQGGHLPKRNFADLKEFQALLASESEIIFDVTEMGIQRAHDYEEQKKDYSGKKKAYEEESDFDEPR